MKFGLLIVENCNINAIRCFLVPQGGFRETDIEEVQGVQAFEESTFGYALCNTLRSDKLDERQ